MQQKKSLFGKKCVDCGSQHKGASTTMTYPTENLCFECFRDRLYEKSKKKEDADES